jgi:ABC-type transport system substrate-binding protein
VIQQELAEIGIRATLDFSEFSTYFAMIGDTTRHVPFGLFGWYADYPDPSNFFDTLLNGHRITAIHNNNVSMFDDATVNAMIERAMVTRDDSSRVRLWQDVDRSVMDEVPMVPMVHALESRLYAPRLGGWYRHLTCVLKLESLYIKSDAPGAVAGAHAEQPR